MDMTINIKYAVVTLLLFLALPLAFEQRAYASVDPGSGLLIMQGLGAVFSGAMFYFRRCLRNPFSRSAHRTSSVDHAAIVSGSDKERA
jgi:hypothetical protein